MKNRSSADIIRDAKAAVMRGEYRLAIKHIEQVMTLLKFDYEAGIDRERNGRAFNALARVRKDLIAGHLSEESYATLRIERPAPKKPEAPRREEPAPYVPSKNPGAWPGDEPAPKKKPEPAPEPEPEPEPKPTPEEAALAKGEETQFHWDEIPTVTFDDIAGLDECKALVERKVLLPLLHPEMLEGYVAGGGGGVCLYGPPGTGKTMISAAIANRIQAKFCSITPSDLLQQGLGNTEKAVKALFAEARSFPCAVIYFDEMDSIAPKNTKSTAARQLRSEFLAQLQGVSSYGKKSKNILFLICATNKPWDIDSAFLRPGRFGTKIYVGLPDEAARRYIITHRLEKIGKKGQVEVKKDIDLDLIVEKTNGFNCADVSNFLNSVEEVSLVRAMKTGEKFIQNNDFLLVLRKSVSSVQADDIIKLDAWRKENDAPISFDDEDLSGKKEEPKPEPEPKPAPEPAPVPEPEAPKEEVPAVPEPEPISKPETPAPVEEPLPEEPKPEEPAPETPANEPAPEEPKE